MAVSKIVFGTKFRGHDASIFAIFPEESRVRGISTERLTRYKHDLTMPIDALERLIACEQIDTKAVKEVVLCNAFTGVQVSVLPENFYLTEMLLRKHLKAKYKKDFDQAHDKYAQKSGFEKVISLLTSFYGWGILREKILLHVGLKKFLPIAEIERKTLGRYFPNATIEIRFYDHEYCHVVSALATSRFDESIIFSFDGWGDDNFSEVYVVRGNKLEHLASSAPDDLRHIYAGPKGSTHVLCSPGGVYTYVTEMLGFTPIADEGKVEALAAYGKADAKLLTEFSALVSIDKSSSKMVMSRAKTEALLRFNNFSEYLKRLSREDMAATTQKFLEAITFDYVTLLVAKTGIKNLALAGGVAANVINNLNIYEKITPNIHITPAMADDGAAQGAAYAYLLDMNVAVADIRAMTPEMPYYGTSYSRAEILAVVDKNEFVEVEDLGDAWPLKAAELLAAGKIGAIFHGNMEWGPRALGNRSIIADVRQKDFRERINLHIKRRPAFQPFCPSILAEEKDRLFEAAYLNKHMTCAFRLKKEFWDVLPSAIHIDGTARAQFVEERDNPSYFKLLRRVKELTGFGIVINTSFNKHGRTIVESPEDALRDFLDTDMDYMIIEGYLVQRKSVSPR